MICVINKSISDTDKPIYCKDCKKPNTWERDRLHDVKDVDGKLMWQSWICGLCKHTTLRRIGVVKC